MARSTLDERCENDSVVDSLPPLLSQGPSAPPSRPDSKSSLQFRSPALKKYMNNHDNPLRYALKMPEIMSRRSYQGKSIDEIK